MSKVPGDISLQARIAIVGTGIAGLETGGHQGNTSMTTIKGTYR